MGTLEIVLLLAGAVVLAVSFFLPVGQGSLSRETKELAEEEIKRLVAHEADGAKKRMGDAADAVAERALEKAERGMERISNEKIMAVSEYSDTVLQEINKNHQEVLFLYDMLNDKHTSLKSTVAKVGDVVKAVRNTISEAQAAVENFAQMKDEIELSEESFELCRTQAEIAKGNFELLKKEAEDAMGHYRQLKGETEAFMSSLGQIKMEAEATMRRFGQLNLEGAEATVSSFRQLKLEEAEAAVNNFSRINLAEAEAAMSSFQQLKDEAAAVMSSFRQMKEEAEASAAAAKMQSPGAAAAENPFGAAGMAQRDVSEEMLQDRVILGHVVRPAAAEADSRSGSLFGQGFANALERYPVEDADMEAFPAAAFPEDAPRGFSSREAQPVDSRTVPAVSKRNPFLKKNPPHSGPKGGNLSEGAQGSRFGRGSFEGKEYSNNERILALHGQGKSTVAIAKELGLGVGEVKLVIGLYKNA